MSPFKNYMWSTKTTGMCEKFTTASDSSNLCNHLLSKDDSSWKYSLNQLCTSKRHCQPKTLAKNTVVYKHAQTWMFGF